MLFWPDEHDEEGMFEEQLDLLENVMFSFYCTH